MLFDNIKPFERCTIEKPLLFFILCPKRINNRKIASTCAFFFTVSHFSFQPGGIFKYRLLYPLVVNSFTATPKQRQVTNSQGGWWCAEWFVVSNEEDGIFFFLKKKRVFQSAVTFFSFQTWKKKRPPCTYFSSLYQSGSGMFFFFKSFPFLKFLSCSPVCVSSANIGGRLNYRYFMTSSGSWTKWWPSISSFIISLYYFS